MNVLMLLIGVVFFAATVASTPFAWLILAATLATYAGLVRLSLRAARSPSPALAGGGTAGPQARDLSPDRRARWLPRGETREKVEAALQTHRKVVAAIEGSDDVTRAVLEDAIPKLDATAERLVDVALAREKAAETVRETGSGSEARDADLREIEAEIRAADAEISGISEKLLDMRARVVRVSIGDAGATREAAALNSSLDELNLRLEALGETMSPPGSNPPSPRS